MNHHAESPWPFWISLGGETTLACTNSVWLLATICLLSLGILIGYCVIAKHWGELEHFSKNEKSKAALRDLKWIFLLCGLCGYGMPIVRALCPAWSLNVISLILLNAVTYRYISQLKALSEIHQDAELLEQLKREVKRQVENETAVETAERCKRMLDAHLARDE